MNLRKLIKLEKVHWFYKKVKEFEENVQNWKFSRFWIRVQEFEKSQWFAKIIYLKKSTNLKKIMVWKNGHEFAKVHDL